MQIVALDVQYGPEGTGKARVGAVRFEQFTDKLPQTEFSIEVEGILPYQPGAFYQRELPPLLALLEVIPGPPPEILIIDGYVQLGDGKPGLGQYLFDCLGRKVAVIGVAKTEFRDAPCLKVVRHGTKPLYVTSVGILLADAVLHIQRMAGKYRIPDLLKRVDHVARGLDVNGQHSLPLSASG